MGVEQTRETATDTGMRRGEQRQSAEAGKWWGAGNIQVGGTSRRRRSWGVGATQKEGYDDERMLMEWGVRIKEEKNNP